MHEHTATKPKRLSWRDFWVGYGCEVVMTATFGQPLDVVKTRIADSGGNKGILRTAAWVVRGEGVSGLYRGLFPWVFVEPLTGGVLTVVNLWAHERLAPCAASLAARADLSPAAAFAAHHALSGAAAGVAQGVCIQPILRARTAEITRPRDGRSAQAYLSDLVRKEGTRCLFRGGVPILLRQATNWASRFGISKYAETRLCSAKRTSPSQSCPLSLADRALCSLLGGVLSCWNHPLDVIGVVMQSKRTDPRASRGTFTSAARYVYATSGLVGFSRGLGPRVLLSSWATVCMVFGVGLVRTYV
ncbi:Citrate/oxoglutarate carrier protein [Diplonema papillatum]|nr:Citrate/oxoglutarate carrier protein [Diplonema papillatum]